MKHTKTLLFSVVVAVVVIGSISVFSLNDNNISKDMENLDVEDSVSINETVEINVKSDRELIPYSPPTSGEPSIIDIQIELSHLPVLNEVTNMTASVQNPGGFPNFKVTFDLKNGWEFVNVPESEIELVIDRKNNTFYRTYEIVTVPVGDYQNFTKQVKPTQEGETKLIVGAKQYGFDTRMVLFVGENRTLGWEQYYEENPELAPWNIVNEPRVCEFEDCVEPDFNTTHPPVSSSTPTPEEEELMEEYWDRYNNTSSEPGASGASGTITIHGFIKNQPSFYSQSTNIYISDVNVCAWDYDNLIVKQKLGCDYTENGYFKLLDIPNTDEDGTTLDLYFTLSTNSQHSSIVDSSGDFYILTLPTENNIPNRNFFLSETIDSTGTLEETKYHRAFGITDTIADARDFFSYNNQNVEKVNIKWQHDELSDFFSANNTPGASYFRNSDTIYLDGLDNSSIRPDDSEQRFTILHEWGHHQMHDAFVGWPAICNPHAHPIQSPNTEGCAWTEGWADFIPFLVDNTSTYDIELGFSYNVEEDYVTVGTTVIPLVNMTNGVDVGHTVEGHIAGALWDIMDPIGTGSYDQRNNTNKDTVSLGHDEIISVFAKEDLTFEGFYNQWNVDYPNTNDIDNIMYLHHMGFYTPPVTPPTTGSMVLYDDFEGTLDKWTITADGSRNWGIISDQTSVEAVDANKA